MRQLTTRNLEVLAAMAKLQSESGFPATVREIGHRTNLSSPSTVQYHLERLVSFGLVARKGTRRAITTTGWSTLNRPEMTA